MIPVIPISLPLLAGTPPPSVVFLRSAGFPTRDFLPVGGYPPPLLSQFCLE